MKRSNILKGCVFEFLDNLLIMFSSDLLNSNLYGAPTN